MSTPLSTKLDAKLDGDWTMSAERVQLLVDDGTRVIRVPRPASGAPPPGDHRKRQQTRGASRQVSHDDQPLGAASTYDAHTSEVHASRHQPFATWVRVSGRDETIMTEWRRRVPVPFGVASGDAP